MSGDKLSKFVIVTHSGAIDQVTRQQHQDVHLFARGDNRMVVGAVVGDQATFGENPNDSMKRVFLSAADAVAWLKQTCREYAGREDVDFVHESPEQNCIVVPVSPLPKLRNN